MSRSVTHPWSSKSDQDILGVIQSDLIKVSSIELNSSGWWGRLDPRFNSRLLSHATLSAISTPSRVWMNLQVCQRIKISTTLVVHWIGSTRSEPFQSLLSQPYIQAVGKMSAHLGTLGHRIDSLALGLHHPHPSWQSPPCPTSSVIIFPLSRQGDQELTEGKASASCS